MRTLIVLATTTIAVVVATTAIAVLFLRQESAPPGVVREAAVPSAPEQHAAAQPLPAVVRAVPKVPPPHVDSAPTPARRSAMRRTDRVAANVVTDPSTGAERTTASDRGAAVDRPHPHATDAPPGADAAAQRQRQMESLARDVIDGLRAAGETGGLAAFPPPGTVPIKVGIVVPDGFQLPDGYMRYYQNTDDGERLQPILMFSPDYDFVDANGNPVALPKDGIVPPEMAPPGMPQRMLELPKTRTAGPDSRRPGS